MSNHIPQNELPAAFTAIEGANFSALFINRPIATVLLSIAVVLTGILSYLSLPISSLPQVEFAVINVTAALPGADPETMASSVVTPLERQFSRIAGINELTSVSSLGNASITLQFDLDRGADGAARDVQAAINAARSQLPASLPQNPSYKKVNPGDAPSLTLALTSDTLTSAQLYDEADSVLAQQIAQVSGVGQVTVSGSASPAVRVEANPLQLSESGLGLEALRTVLGNANVNHPTGLLDNGMQRYAISTSGQLFQAKAYARLPIAVTAASRPTALSSTGVMRLHDVADVLDSVEDINTYGSFNGKPAILLNVLKAPGANVIEMTDNVLAILPELRAAAPPAVNISIALNRTVAIRESVKEVTRSLMLSILLVMFVVFLFLRELRSTLIPSISVPLSLLGTFAVMRALGYTLDNLSLMALTISTGFVVDDAIVVMENIIRHLDEGLTPYDAALRGSREIGFTVISMSTSLIAVFIPILLMGGIVGRLFREFAVTLSVSVFLSLIVSLTTTPMLSAQFLRPHDTQKHGRIYRFAENMFAWWTHQYNVALRWVLRSQSFMLGVTLVTFGLSVYLFTIVPKGFFPEMDSGRLIGQVRGQQDVSFEHLRQKSVALARILQGVPGVKNVMLNLGSNAGATASVSAFLEPSEDRLREGNTVEAVLQNLRMRAGSIPGAALTVQSSQELRIGARTSAALYQYSLTTENLADLDEWTPKLTAALEKIPLLKDVNTDQQDHSLRTQIDFDRDAASRLGISPLDIDNTLQDAFSQRQVSTMYTALNQYHVVLEVAPQFRDNPSSLQGIFVKSTSGAMVPLSALTRVSTRWVPLTVNHQSQMPAATLSFNLTPGASLGQATAAIEDARLRIGMPSSIRGGFQGTAQAFQASLASEPYLIVLALITVYIVLGMLYESLIHPLTILSTLPSAGIGAILALLLFKVDLSVIAMIGMILLIGIVKKNAIMMIDFALVAEREAGKSPHDAIYEACLLRFRPIMMTTMAALLGGVPLALGTGPGSELRRPLGITIIGGLVVSQALTLFTTPVVYLFFDRLRTRTARSHPVAVLSMSHD